MVIKNTKKIFKPSIKAFTMWEVIISLIMVSICVITINAFLPDMLHYLVNLKNQVENFCVTRNIDSCYFIYKNHQFCEDQISKLPKSINPQIDN